MSLGATNMTANNAFIVWKHRRWVLQHDQKPKHISQQKTCHFQDLEPNEWMSLFFHIFVKSGGAGDRSRCLLHAKQALYHLSYTPDDIKHLLLVIKTIKRVQPLSTQWDSLQSIILAKKQWRGRGDKAIGHNGVYKTRLARFLTFTFISYARLVSLDVYYLSFS